jgi:hypothetical protein
MYDKTYLMVKKLWVEIHRLKYNHVDEPEIYNKTIEIINSLKQLELILKQKIED